MSGIHSHSPRAAFIPAHPELVEGSPTKIEQNQFFNICRMKHSGYHLDDAPSNTYNKPCGAFVDAGVAELADAADLKSAGAILVGSSPTPGTIPDSPV